MTQKRNYDVVTITMTKAHRLRLESLAKTLDLTTSALMRRIIENTTISEITRIDVVAELTLPMPVTELTINTHTQES